MADSYDLIFLGLSPDNAADFDGEAAIRDIAGLLEIDARHIEELLRKRISGVVKPGLSREAANQYQTEVARLGGVCNYRPAVERRKAFELAPIETPKPAFTFTCPACKHTLAVELEEELPAACPACGVVPSKYDKVAKIKGQKQKTREPLAAQDPAGLHEAAIRWQQLENAARQEAAAPKSAAVPHKAAARRRGELFGTAFLLWLLGVAMGAVGAAAYYETERLEELRAVRQNCRPQAAPAPDEDAAP